jgi:DNA-directed RNA polymerase sigma subunit (sigma70/sigma32)
VYSVWQKDVAKILSKLTKKCSKVIEKRWILVDGDQEAQGGTRSSEARERS